MRPFQHTIPLEDARRIIDHAIRPLTATEVVPLTQASGRVLAADIVAGDDVPPFSRAAMDGYAVRAQDTAGATRGIPCSLRRVGRVFTGEVPNRAVGAGECVEVATGAPMPGDADAVVMVEDTHEDGGIVSILAGVQAQQNVGRQGADIQRGQLVLRAGEVLNPSRIGAVAALGIPHVQVRARPRVAILSTGNEVVDPGTPLPPGHVYDINRFTTMSLLTEHGALPVPLRTAADTVEDLSRAVDECLQEDMMVFSGGSSVGERDLMLDVIRARGQMLFHGVAIKPGKPLAFGSIAGKPVFGLPGYPTSCLSNAYIFVVPAVRRMAGLPGVHARTVTAPLSRTVSSTPGRHQFYTVRLEGGMAVPAFKASGDITSMSQADGYIEIPAGVDAVQKDTLVEVRLF